MRYEKYCHVDELMKIRSLCLLPVSTEFEEIRADTNELRKIEENVFKAIGRFSL